MTFNLYRVKSVEIQPVKSHDGAIWQTIVVHFEHGTFELTMFPTKNGETPLLTPTAK